QLIAWIEDQKIRHYRIEDRLILRDIDHKDWDSAFHKYLSDISCPIGSNQTDLVLDWILTTALRFEYRDHLEKYRKPADDYESRSVTPTNPIDGLDFDSDEFKDGVNQLARLLKVAAHPTNHLCTLSAITLVIKNHISMESNDKSEDKVKLKTNNRELLDNKSMQLKTGSNDSVLTNSAKILRLLYINDLRELQTTVN
ncbi:unnamed protein product, partial [Oppiella nova]